MRLVWAVIPLILIFMIGIVGIQESFALSCMPSTWDEEFDRVDVVFTGTIITKEYLPFDDEMDKTAISTIQVEEIFKGTLNDTVKIKSNEGFWGIYFSENWRYVIFGNHNEDFVNISLCSKSGILPPIPDSERIELKQHAENNLKQLKDFLLEKNIPFTDFRYKESFATEPTLPSSYGGNVDSEDSLPTSGHVSFTISKLPKLGETAELEFTFTNSVGGMIYANGLQHLPINMFDSESFMTITISDNFEIVDDPRAETYVDKLGIDHTYIRELITPLALDESFTITTTVKAVSEGYVSIKGYSFGGHERGFKIQITGNETLLYEDYAKKYPQIQSIPDITEKTIETYIGIVNDINRVYIADQSTSKISVYDHDDHLLFEFGTTCCRIGLFHLSTPELLDISGIKIDNTGQIYVSDINNHRIHIFDNNGTNTHRFGDLLWAPMGNDNPANYRQIDSEGYATRGLKVSTVICDENHELVFKYSNNFPACVTHLTAEKLIQRNWAHHIIDSSNMFEQST